MGGIGGVYVGQFTAVFVSNNQEAALPVAGQRLRPGGRG
jgi:hypothetical protein